MAISLGLSLLMTILAYRQLVPYNQIVKDQLPLSKQIEFWNGWTGIWQQEKSILQEPSAAHAFSASKASEAEKNDNGIHAENTNHDNVLFPE